MRRRSGQEAEIDALRRNAITPGCDTGRGAGRAEGQSGMSDARKMDRFRLRLPATSANLGPGFDAVAVALDFALEIEAEAAQEFSIAATGRDADRCGRLEDNLILEIYKDLLEANGRPIVPLALQVTNGIPLGMGCGSSAAARLAAIALAVHFGQLGWDTDRVLEEAYALEGHPDNVAACWLGGFVSAVCEGQTRARGAGRSAARRGVRLWRCPPSRWPPARRVRCCRPPMRWKTWSRICKSVAVLGLAFAQARGDLLRLAMNDRIHQPYRAPFCPLLPLLLPLVGENGILGVALSGAGPAVLVVVEDEKSLAAASLRN